MRLNRFFLPAILLTLAVGFWASPDFQVIAAGVAIFLFGMLMLEDGFRLFTGGLLEAVLKRATGSIPKSLLFGIVTTTLVQSSSLVSVITISFLSAGLISLLAGIGVIFGANIGTTTGAWLVAGFGLKVNISAYALPMLAVAVVLVFQSSKYIKGAGLVLAGLGFLFLGIHYMKEGFEAFRDNFDLARFAMTGFSGLLVYTLVGAAVTVLMQSSHASLVLVITALAAGQISFENALALTIGANIGTTITAVLASLTSNHLGRRLALADVVFKVFTAGVALTFIVPIRHLLDTLSAAAGIPDTEFTLKLALFHTLFNVLGVALFLPVLHRLIAFLERAIPEPVEDLSKPKYLNEAVDEFPETVAIALRKEVGHLYDNAVEIITHGLNLHRSEIYASKDIAATVAASRRPFDYDIDARYDKRIKTLFSAIIEFATRATAKDIPVEIAEEIYDLRDAAEATVRAIKAVKHMRAKAQAYSELDQGAITELYNELRTEIARIIVEIHKLDLADPDDRSTLWLDQERVQVEHDAKTTNARVETLIRDRAIDPYMATSFLNDSGYAYAAMRDLLAAARMFDVESSKAVAEIEEILQLDDDEVQSIGTGGMDDDTFAP